MSGPKINDRVLDMSTGAVGILSAIQEKNGEKIAVISGCSRDAEGQPKDYFCLYLELILEADYEDQAGETSEREAEDWHAGQEHLY